MSHADQSHWYKDAIIYELHVKAFQDANNDGVGDFAGLIERLDYIQDLGVTAIWLLPFYPSPLRDDGYDIADYRAINPSLGDMRDFRRFIAEAKKRDLRVITELVINHTSDQHPWFQRARAAKPGSAWRDFYVWSDTDQKYLDTRIIFIDTETSNWTWDPEAEAFFWHRFYSHQPDLNFDNPRVLEEVVKVMDYWLEMGVDGLRLDAVPYLVEREGTNNENLPETHAILKRIRAQVDAHFPDRMLLAEANQWPEDTRDYFGDGDECHMAFHFPLMPRIYMALGQEDRHPITDIIAQTPEIPDNCQWAIFLRNHDELTLEMVTDSERDYLWSTYAYDQRARLNLGIRRRLAPLLDNDRRKIELLNGLLLSLPGTPVIYYGDEIGMGDNYYLGDRDGVRTPMQWSADRNGGFSRADPQRLFLPPVMDPIYGYEAVNVEAQQKNGSSMLSWMRRMIAVRKSTHAFGRGMLSFLYPRNRKVLAYLRQYDGEDILCVFNLSRTAQAVEIDLSAFKGRVPIEMTGRSPFPPVGELPYLLTLPAFGFFWFALEKEAEAPIWHETAPQPLPDFMTLVFTDSWRTVEQGPGAERFQHQVLPEFLQHQRWFGVGMKEPEVRDVSLRPLLELTSANSGAYLLAIVDCEFTDGEKRSYFLPMTKLWGEEHLRPDAAHLAYTLAKIRRGPHLGALTDAAAEPGFAYALVQQMQNAGAEGSETAQGFHFECTDRLRGITLPATLDYERPTTEQFNVLLVLAEQVALKIYRRQRAGIHPEIEVGRFLAKAGFVNTPPFLGAIEYSGPGKDRFALAAAFGHVVNQGTGWMVLSEGLDRQLERRELTPAEPESDLPDLHSDMSLELVRTLGDRTAEMHCAFASDTKDPAFRPEPVKAADLKRWSKSAMQTAKRAFADLKQVRKEIILEPITAFAIDELISRQGAVEGRLRALCDAATPSGVKIRHHGDYHLGHVLIAHTDIFVFDFEGDPNQNLEDRRAKNDPMRDVAAMLQSFDYIAGDAIQRSWQRGVAAHEPAERYAYLWRDEAQQVFLDAYRNMLSTCRYWPMSLEETFARLDLFLWEKVLYEVSYEVHNRPNWLAIPVYAALRQITESEKASS